VVAAVGQTLALMAPAHEIRLIHTSPQVALWLSILRRKTPCFSYGDISRMASLRHIHLGA
jgi:hypothetical protein